MSPIAFGVLVFVGVIGFIAVGYLISVYNGLVFLKNQVDRAWANIDVILKQRHDEIPQLLSVCEQYAQYERSTIDRVASARKEYAQARTLDDKIHAAGEMSLALQGVLAIGEAYPELKSSEQFVHLQTRISGLEAELSDRRELFNETVTNFNTRIQQIPDVFVAGPLGYQALPLYQVAEYEKQRPDIRMKLPA